MGRVEGIALGIAASLWLCACARPSAKGGAGAAPGLPRIPAITRFRPPADGLLTNRQLDTYLRVRRAARGRSDEEAARAVGADPEECSWVRTRVVEALVFLDTAQVRSASETIYARTIASMKEASRSVKDRETLRRMNEQIAGLEREKATLRPEQPPAALAGNARRVAPRRAEIEAARP